MRGIRDEWERESTKCTQQAGENACMHVRRNRWSLCPLSRSDTFSFIHLFCFALPHVFTIPSHPEWDVQRLREWGTFNSFSSLFESRENNNSRRETEGQTQFWRILSTTPKRKENGTWIEWNGKRQQAGKAIEPSFPVFENRALMRSPIKKAYQRRGRKDADDRRRMERKKTSRVYKTSVERWVESSTPSFTSISHSSISRYPQCEQHVLLEVCALMNYYCTCVCGSKWAVTVVKRKEEEERDNVDNREQENCHNRVWTWKGEESNKFCIKI